MKLDWKIILALAVVVIVLYLFFKSEAKEAAKSLLDAVNPVNPNNIFAGGVNAVGEAIVGPGSGWTLGGALFGAFHDDDLNDTINAPVRIGGG